jgi:hypothetical protein
VSFLLGCLYGHVCEIKIIGFGECSIFFIGYFGLWDMGHKKHFVFKNPIGNHPLKDLSQNWL